MSQVDSVFDGAHCRRVGTVEHDELRVPSCAPEGSLEDLGSDARASHSQKHSMAYTLGFRPFRQGQKIVQLLVHRLGEF